MNQVNITKNPSWELRIRSSMSQLSSSEQRVAEYVLRSPGEVCSSNIRDLAKSNGVSESTVVRFLRRAGYSGLKGLKTALTQDYLLDNCPGPSEVKLTGSDTVDVIKEKVFQGCVDALTDTMSVLDSEQLQKAIEAVDAAPYVEIFGIGGSASVARSALHCFRKLGMRVNFVSELDFSYLQAETFNQGDVVLAVSRSGETEPVIKAVSLAKEKGAFILSITNIQQSSLFRLSDCCLTSVCQSRMLPGDETYERVAQLAVVRTLYAGVAIRRAGRELGEELNP